MSFNGAFDHVVCLCLGTFASLFIKNANAQEARGGGGRGGGEGSEMGGLSETEIFWDYLRSPQIIIIIIIKFLCVKTFHVSNQKCPLIISY